VDPTPDGSPLAGFAQPERAARDLERLHALWTLSLETRTSLLTEVRQSHDPDATLSSLTRLAEALSAAELSVPERLPSAWQALLALVEASNFWIRHLLARPALLPWLAGNRALHREQPRTLFARKALAATRRAEDLDVLYRRLRRFKYRELLRLTVRELRSNPTPGAIGREMSALAEALVAAALSASYAELVRRFGLPVGADPDLGASGFCCLGLGKLGGEDLNYSSDIDLIFVYREDGQTLGGTSGSLTHVQLYTKLAEATAKALSAATADGFCFRVDLNLRPQGRSGALVLSLGATLAYYEAFGRTWERSALIKARPIAGDLLLGEQLLEGLSPFVWRRSLDLSAVDELREIKAQIDLRGKASAPDVKLGPGGIREVEFFVSALQLLHGGKEPSLRERGTLKALRKLHSQGLVSAPDADALEEAYLFLRKVENRLQMVEERQTQDLPESDPDRLRLARSLGFSGWSALDAELSRHRRFVQQAFSTLLGQTARNLLPDEPLLALALDVNVSPQAREEALHKRGFEQSGRAMAALERLGRVPESPFSGSPSDSAPALRLLSEVARTPDPDQALMHLADFLTRLRAPQSYLGLLTQLPQATRRLVNLFGQSDFLSQYFLRHPELLDALVQSQFDRALKEPATIRHELAMRAHRHTGSDVEERLTALRRFKNEEVLRIGLNDISNELDVPQVAAQLTALADGALDEVLFLAESEARERYGEPRSGGVRQGLTVIGLGKLGGGELGYHSDLDLIFVYSGDGQEETSGGARGKITHHEYFARLVQRLLSFLQLQLREGDLYKVDTRLRPSGNKGTLVVSQQAFLEHHEKRAQLWERQALVKARVVAGDAALFEVLSREVIIPLVYERPLPANAAAEIDRLRMRMEREVSQESEDQVNTKSGHGGLVDVEFTAQYLQLLHGGTWPALRTTHTLTALEGLRTAGLLSTGDAEVLRQGYLFQRGVENRLRLIHGQSLSLMPTKGRPLALLARRLGYLGPEAAESLLSDYRAYSLRVREAYARILRAM
jgi:[glutamine synthetase] adenylyltransferase / [glutamine synthetase]-adenylyl-L-tyrosine phosphorylase